MTPVSVNQTAESYYMKKVKNSKSHQRQSWMTVSKNWCKLNIDLNTDKHEDWSLVFANQEDEEEIYPLTTIEIAEAQRKDQELKV
jgi:hypothetical protein